MSPAENLIAALCGEVPERTPVSADDSAFPEKQLPMVQGLLGKGMVFTQTARSVELIKHGVEERFEQSSVGRRRHVVDEFNTPVGSVRQSWTDGWREEFFVKSPKDYTTLQWVAENIEPTPHYDKFLRREEIVGERGLVMVAASRSPAMTVALDWAGVGRFKADLAAGVKELFALCEAMRRPFVGEAEAMAKGPGTFVRWSEGRAVDVLGTKFFEKLVAPLYDDCLPILHKGGKRVVARFEGPLRAGKSAIAKAKFDALECIAEPPHGDMTLDDCRKAWPGKALWTDVDTSMYSLSPERFKEEISAKWNRAGKAGLAFNIPSAPPENWQTHLPSLLWTLDRLG